MPQASEPTGAIGTVEKAVDILFHLHEAGEPRGVTAIGRGLGLPKSSAHRLLTALGKRGLVEQDERGRYRPGFSLIALGLGVLEGEPVAAAARPVLEAQAAELGETFFVVVARAGRLVVLDKAEGSGFLRAAPRVGAHVPVHATAVGKLYLAFGPELLAEASRERFTEHTLVDDAELAAEVREARRIGWAENRDEWIPGLSVVAAPVHASGRLVGALALAAATPRLGEIGSSAAAERLIAAAANVAARLEGRKP